MTGFVPIAKKIKALATSRATDEDRLQVLIHLTAELAEEYTVAYASGAAAKVLHNAGFTKKQFLRMMDAAWDIMLPENKVTEQEGSS
jgi:hypothetical protein